MTDTETASYLQHHLELSGRKDTLFADDAIALLRLCEVVVYAGRPPRWLVQAPSTPTGTLKVSGV